MSRFSQSQRDERREEAMLERLNANFNKAKASESRSPDNMKKSRLKKSGSEKLKNAESTDIRHNLGA